MVATLFAALPANAQDSSSPAEPSAETAKPAPDEPPGGKRVLGVLPNYRTADESAVGTPLSAGHKFYIASKDSFDYPLVLLGRRDGWYRTTGESKTLLSDKVWPAYGRRLGYWICGSGNRQHDDRGAVPVMLHQDPRYFRRGEGSKVRVLFTL